MDMVLDILRTLAESPWVFALVFVVTALDSLFPIVPAETVLITAATYAVSGTPHPLGLIVAATIGAVIGDFASHCVGRGGGRLGERWMKRDRMKAIVDRSESMFRRRGGLMLIVGRFIPGGRTATTITSGVLHYPRRKFLLADAIGSLAWAVYSCAIGFLGAMIVEDQPLLGVAMGIGLALAITGIVELLRRVFARRARRGQASPRAERNSDLNSAAAASTSSASVRARTTTIRSAPASTTSARRGPADIPPMANHGLTGVRAEAATCRRRSGPTAGLPGLVGVSHTGPTQ